MRERKKDKLSRPRKEYKKKIISLCVVVLYNVQVDFVLHLNLKLAAEKTLFKKNIK